MSINPNQFTRMSSQIADIYTAIEDQLIDDIVRRLKAPREAGVDYVLQWQLERLNELRLVNNDVIRAIASNTGLMEEQIRYIFNEVGYGTVEGLDKEVEALGRTPLPIPTDLDARLGAFAALAIDDLNNLINETLISTNLGEGLFVATYRRILEETTAQVLAGGRTINQALVEAVTRVSEEGLPSGFVDRGGRRWNIEQYAQTVLRTTVNNTYNELRLSRMQQHGIDLVLVSTKPDARPQCARIQGGVASLFNPSSNGKYPSIYEFGYGEPSGLRGISCAHLLIPFIDGVNENNQETITEEEAAEGFKESQQQRAYERAVRQAKRNLKIAEELGVPEEIERYKRLISNRQKRVRDFVKETNRTRRYENERVIL